jgi:hypothetical protein
MGRVHLKYLDCDEQYLICNTCSTHIASIEVEYLDDLNLGGLS